MGAERGSWAGMREAREAYVAWLREHQAEFLERELEGSLQPGPIPAGTRAVQGVIDDELLVLTLAGDWGAGDVAIRLDDEPTLRKAFASRLGEISVPSDLLDHLGHVQLEDLRMDREGFLHLR